MPKKFMKWFDQVLLKITDRAWIASLILVTVALYLWVMNVTFPSLQVIVVLSGLLCALMLLDLLLVALNVKPTRNTKLENLLKEFNYVQLWQKTNALRQPLTRKLNFEDAYQDIVDQWWEEKIIKTFIRRTYDVVSKILLILLLLTCIAIYYNVLSNYEGFSGLTSESNLVDYIYVVCQLVFLIGLQNVHPVQPFSVFFSIGCFIIGFIILGAYIDRLIEPVDKELKDYKEALDILFRS